MNLKKNKIVGLSDYIAKKNTNKKVGNKKELASIFYHCKQRSADT